MSSSHRDIKLNNIDEELKKIHDDAILKEENINNANNNYVISSNRKSINNILKPEFIKYKK